MFSEDSACLLTLALKRRLSCVFRGQRQQEIDHVVGNSWVCRRHWMHTQFPGDGSYQHEQELRKQLAQCGVNAELQTTRAAVSLLFDACRAVHGGVNRRLLTRT